ncbi:hypothetical protein CW708_00180 [Candidatus Bathyarchaeota archaeon]|nr:MAG: hypothetical protein CW708_00180 [Candidatus Bathyarchaeota archaeon]
MPETAEKKRMELYKKRDVQIFLSKFLSGEIKKLEPVYDLKHGYHYPLIEEIIGKTSNVKAFLQELYDAGILERKLYDKLTLCPKCNSSSVSVHFSCPYCKSFNIKRSSLIEHVKCGYMDVEENFRKNNKLICPKCHEELKKLDVDYRKAGVWCTCKDCGKSFDIPTTTLFCRNCHTNFTFEDAIFEDIYIYSLKEEAKREASLSWTMITPIRELLIKNGFKVESPAFLKGKSGAKHMFDIAAYKDRKENVMVIDLTISKDVVSEQPVIALFAKMYDVSPNKAYLIAIPKISEDGKKMGMLYKIEIIEAQDQKSVVEALQQKLKLNG